MRLQWRLWVCALLVVSWLPGCGKDESSPDDESSESGTFTGDGNGGSEGETGSTSGSGSSATASDGGGDSSDDGACPADPADDECRVCVKANCCSHWATCQADAICQCTLDCVLEGNSPGSCKNPCGGENDLYRAVYFCGQSYCLGRCDWDCC